MISNMEKQELYIILKTRLKIALQQEFYLEAVMIEYNIIDDRVSSMLKHAGITYLRSDGKNMDLLPKIKKVRNATRDRRKPIYRKVPDELMEKTDEWRVIRNKLVHERCQNIYDSEEVKQCAVEGNELVRQLSNAAKAVNRAAEKINN